MTNPSANLVISPPSGSGIRGPGSALDETVPPRAEPEPRTPNPEQSCSSSFFARLHRSTAGTVAITFLICLPILLFIISIITQYALIVNARIALDHAAAVAARSAVTTLPTNPAVDIMDGEAFPDDVDFATDLPDPSDPGGRPRIDGVDCINRAARIQLSAISPQAKSDPGQSATAIAAALQTAGLTPPSGFAARYAYAAAATTVSWAPAGQPADFARAGPKQIQLTLHYNFYLNAPGVKVWGPLLTHQLGTTQIAGVTGYFLPMTSTITVQLSPGREAQSDGNGNPQ